MPSTGSSRPSTSTTPQAPTSTGTAGPGTSVEWLLSVFPDHRFDIEHIAADGETVAVLGTMVGTHEGELMGIAPTGRRVAAQQSHWFRVVEGKLTEHWAVRDDLGMMQQLGVLPA